MHKKFTKIVPLFLALCLIFSSTVVSANQAEESNSAAPGSSSPLIIDGFEYPVAFELPLDASTTTSVPNPRPRAYDSGGSWYWANSWVGDEFHTPGLTRDVFMGSGTNVPPAKYAIVEYSDPLPHYGYVQFSLENNTWGWGDARIIQQIGVGGAFNDKRTVFVFEIGDHGWTWENQGFKFHVAYFYYLRSLASSAANEQPQIIRAYLANTRTPADTGVPTLPILFENGKWAPELGGITIHTPRGSDGIHDTALWAYEDGMIRLTSSVPFPAHLTNNNQRIPFRFVFDHTIDIRGYDAVVMELEEPPTGNFLRAMRFRIDEDTTTVNNTITTTTVRMTGGTDRERLRGVGALPDFGQTVRIKKIYLEGDGIISTPAAISRREIRDIVPPRTGNTPVREITTSPQYTGTVAWSPDHETFQPNTVYTATITLTPKHGWTLSGVAANWFRLYDTTGNDAANTLTHAAGANVLTKTFAATIPEVPYPEPTQYVVLSFDDTISPETNELLDVLEANNIPATFFTIGMNLEKANRLPEYARALTRLQNGVHEMGHHTWQHERWTRADPAARLSDFNKTYAYMNQLFGKNPVWIRFPYNDQNADIVAVAGTLGLANLWGFDTNDWSIDRSASYLINRVLTQTGANDMLRDGRIYVHHDHDNNQNSTKEALPEIAHYFRSKGVDFMTASELVKRNNVTVTPGQTYNNLSLPSRIVIDTQPVTSTTVKEGTITGNLTASATVTPSATPTYQWRYKKDSAHDWENISNATSSTLTIPTILTEGTYYFYCVASAPNAASTTSNVVTVHVTEPDFKGRVLFENGKWAEELGAITFMSPLAGSSDAAIAATWAMENGMLRVTNPVPASRNIEFRWTFDNTVDMRGYDAVVMELDEAPTGWLRTLLRFNIDQDDQFSSESHGSVIRMAGTGSNSNFNLFRNRLRGVGILPAYGDTVKIKRIYLEGDGVIPVRAINLNDADYRAIMEIMPPRTGNTPVRTITTSYQYTGTVAWSPDHATFQPNTEYTATLTLTPKEGWTFQGVPENWFRIFNPTGTGTGATGTGSGTTHAANSGIITKTFPVTTPVVPYPEATRFVAFSFDDTPGANTNDLLDVIEELGIKATFYVSGINLERAKPGHPNYRADFARAMERIVAGGHEITNHAWQHERWPDTSDLEVARADFRRNSELIREFSGKYTPWSRIPYSSHSLRSLMVVGEIGMSNLRGYSTQDWDFRYSASRLVNGILTQTGNNAVADGQIYVNHDQPGQTNTRQALPEIVHELRSRGFGFMTISELRAHRNYTVDPGFNYPNFFQNQPVITINTQPASPAAENLVEGNISGSLTAQASANRSAVPAYQWYANTTASAVGGTPVDGATGAAFAVPTDLTAGTYYYYCVVNATAPRTLGNAPTAIGQFESVTAFPVASNVVAVTVTEPPIVNRTVTFDTVGGSPVEPAIVVSGEKVNKPADPVKDGFLFKGWQLDGVAFDFDTSITANITLAAVWEPMITSLRINALSIYTVARGGVYDFELILNEGASDAGVVWTLADSSLGYVDSNGRVTIFDRTGNVRLTATSLDGKISHSITLRIAS